MTSLLRTRLLFALSALGIISALVTPPASALDQGSMGTLTPKNTHLEKEFGPIPSPYPASDSPRQPFAGFRPTGCQSAAHCDFVTFEVDYPKNYQRDVLFGATITLTWDNPRHRETNPAGNDLDLFVWGDDGPAAGGPLSKCGSPGADACDDIYPEIVTMADPQDTVPPKGTPPEDEPDPTATFLTIVNDKGINAGGYKLTVDWFTFTIPPVKAFVPPERETSSTPRGPRVSGPFDFEVSDPSKSGGSSGPEPTPRKILVPGPDGKMHEIELPVYAAGQRLGTSSERNTAVPWITAGIVGALALAGLTFYLVRRNRRAMEM